MSGSELGDLAHFTSSLELMRAIESRPGWQLALDDRGRIRHQYEEQVKRGFGRDWLRRLATIGRVSFVPWRRLDRGILTALQEAHFDREDFKYVETSAATECRVLVSHDPDYSAAVHKVLKRIPVNVVHACEALELPHS
jgi:hypothetical protein